MAKTSTATFGIIGGSGLYDMDGLTQRRELRVSTPFGHPSGPIVLGVLEDRAVAFLARHGRGHRIPPTSINYRANIFALKSLGVRRVFSVSVVGSMKEGIKPGDIVLPDQFIDLTKHRVGTFFDQGIVGHIAFADPICGNLSRTLLEATRRVGGTVREGGIYICIEGPQFSSRAESMVYRRWGVDVIGMTNLPESKLAREAELCFATLALVTDYDCWHHSEEPVSVGAILDIMEKNRLLAQRILRAAVQRVEDSADCGCATALDHAVLTAPEAVPKSVRTRLGPILRRWQDKQREKTK